LPDEDELLHLPIRNIGGEEVDQDTKQITSGGGLSRPPRDRLSIGGEDFASRLKVSGLDLFEYVAPEIEWLPFLGEDGYISVGRSHVVSAYPKVGKTHVLYHCSVDWMRAGYSVTWFTEEPWDIWKHRVHLFSDHWDVPLESYIQNWAGIAGSRMSKEHLFDAFRTCNSDVVIIDTLRDVIRPADENDNSGLSDAVRPFVNESRVKSQTLIILHHDRKQGGRGGRGVAGGSALVGAVDTFLEIGETRDGNRRVSGRGRLSLISDLEYEWAGGRLAAISRPDPVASILAALGTEWAKTSEVVQRTGMPSSTIARHLHGLLGEGVVERDPPDGADVQGKSVRWRIKGVV
jgi:DNA-binding transcriptional ArsR family regulator